MNINYKSDFKIVEVLKSSMVGIPFEFDYSIGNKHIKVGFDGALYEGCTRLSDTQIQVVFDNHQLPCGMLHCTRTFLIPDSDYPDGTKTEVYEDDLNICLVSGSGDKETSIINYVVASVRAITPEQIAQIKSETKAMLMSDPEFIQFIKNTVAETPEVEAEETQN